MKELLKKYPQYQILIDKLDSYKTLDKLNNRIYDYYLQEIEKMMINRNIKDTAFEEGDMIKGMMYSMDMKIPGRDGESNFFSVVNDHPLLGAKFLMTDFCDYIKTKNITLVNDIEFKNHIGILHKITDYQLGFTCDNPTEAFEKLGKVIIDNLDLKIERTGLKYIYSIYCKYNRELKKYNIIYRMA